MRIPQFVRIFTVVALGSLTAWPTEALTETRPPLFSTDREACFGHSGPAIDNECEKAETGQEFGNRPLTRSDDRSFRLTRMPVRQCQL